MAIDYSLYPDLPEEDWPAELVGSAERADYIQRLCAHWDFYHQPPDEAALAMLRDWKEAFERHPLPTSPAYHALCSLFGFAQTRREPYPGWLLWEVLDREDGRDIEAELRLC